jgi:hypothetical protein
MVMVVTTVTDDIEGRYRYGNRSNKKAKFANRTISGIANINVMTRSITLESSQIIKTF